MPNAKVLSEKQAVVKELEDKLKNSCAGVLVDYSGTSVETDTQLRRALRDAGVEYSVVKNTLVRFALDDTGYGALDSHLHGPTALAVSQNDPVAAAKLICEYANKKDSTIKIKVGFVEGKVISEEEIQALAKLPSREALVAQVLGTMVAPITGLVTVLNANIRGLAVALNAIAEKKSA